MKFKRNGNNGNGTKFKRNGTSNGSKFKRNGKQPAVILTNDMTYMQLINMVEKEKLLSPLQLRFAMIYDGNGVAACRIAGYNGSKTALAVQANANLRLPKITEIINARERQHKDVVIINKDITTAIASRVERQEFWTRVMLGVEIEQIHVGKHPDDIIIDLPPKIIDRLRASELLGKSQCDFIERKIVTGEDGGPVKTTLSLDMLAGLGAGQLKQLRILIGAVIE